ncbi:GyrI-like domain-containing protein [Cellulomonas chengniuliangii]|uniref:GyrI-like domain-containing protein n=1 Tax=Cellulomonas chengniuliangii TaxID=2968084 RepID=A0ABY5KZX5_9CELL|nr:GyrI-like domain-containing protein [Cellulomonas chengniuliangii]MCC2309191.1 GyrI-like domain-containing protein [Cellulomonas chengniuliangii]MCC2318535.1 GyrI-like domain-containing protein [Cellulomonas chengniuliangii]UUI75228.1 GyrI-like domain-containing protein [Cellulomonas chengniuliangii]
MAEPVCARRDEQPYAAIRATMTSGSLAEESARLRDVVRLWFHLHEFLPGGGPLLRYLVVDDGARAQVDVGYPVARASMPQLIEAIELGQSPVGEPGAGVHLDRLPAGDYAWVVHEGDPAELDEVRQMLEWWIGSKGLSLDRWSTGRGSAWGGRVEYDLTGGPPDAPDAVCRTELAFRLA